MPASHCIRTFRILAALLLCLLGNPAFSGVADFEFFTTTSESMMPTIAAGDMVLVTEYGDDLPARGDLVAVQPDLQKKEKYIKRVVAIAGDTIRIIDGKVELNGTFLDENYISTALGPDEEPNARLGSMAAVTIAPGHYFLLGDNRFHSVDSRIYGPVGLAHIKGKAGICRTTAGQASPEDMPTACGQANEQGMGKLFSAVETRFVDNKKIIYKMTLKQAPKKKLTPAMQMQLTAMLSKGLCSEPAFKSLTDATVAFILSNPDDSTLFQTDFTTSSCQ